MTDIAVPRELPERDRAQWFDLPTDARDWVGPGGRYAYYLPRVLSQHDWLNARERLAEWDALVGRMIRSCLFDYTEDCRATRQLAEAVAAVAEQMAVALGEQRP